MAISDLIIISIIVQVLILIGVAECTYYFARLINFIMLANKLAQEQHSKESKTKQSE